MRRWLLDRLRGPEEVAETLRSVETSAEPIRLRTLLIIFNPAIEVERGRRLTEVLLWNDPHRLAAQYAADLYDASGGLARFDVVERVEVDEWPRKIDGFSYTDESYLQAWRRRSGFHEPDDADYHAVLKRFGIIERVAAGEIDEVWLFGPPYTGFWESTMAGPGAFWCNSPPVENTGHCPRKFVIMGFNYERGVDCMLENFGHRTESIMSEVYRGYRGERNMWERFCRYDHVAPGRASCGNVHFAPSSTRDYDWGNPRVVWSDCDDWLNYPSLTGAGRQIQCREWGGGDMRLHHLWWLKHLPRAGGISDEVYNNWWRYVLDPNLVC